MHRVFGIKDNAEYIEREGVYLIPCRNNQVARSASMLFAIAKS